MPSEEAKRRARESVPARFTGPMNAATSSYGLLADIPFAFGAAAVLGGVSAAIVRYGDLPVPLSVVGAILAFPLLACLGANILFRNARTRVVAWLASVPFPVDNVNAVLCGSGEYFDIHFCDTVPSREEVMQKLEEVSDEPFVTETDEELRVMSARFGVTDSRHNPAGSAFARYERMRAVVEGALVPMHDRYPIARVLIV